MFIIKKQPVMVALAAI